MSATPSDPIDARMARLEGAYEQLDKRLGTIEQCMAGLEQKVDAGFSELRRDLHAQFYWIVGLVIAGAVLPVVVQLVGP